MSALVQALRAAEVDVTAAGDMLRARVVPGMRGRVAELENTVPGPIAALPTTAQRAALTAFARGVYAALAEPKRSGGDTLEFNDAARTVLPSIEGEHFATGVRAAGGDAPYVSAFAPGLVVTYSVELDLGVRLLSADQVAAWGATDERLAKAALSILFHRSWDYAFRPSEHEGVRSFDATDDLNAARILMLSQSHYEDVRDGALVAIPSPGTLLLCRENDDAALARMKAAAEAEFTAAECPLSPAVFAYERGRFAGLAG